MEGYRASPESGTGEGAGVGATFGPGPELLFDPCN